MKNLKNIVALLIASQILMISCDSELQHGKVKNSNDTITNNDIEEISSIENVIVQSNLSPYKDVDSLVCLLNKSFSFSNMRALDSICEKSDGDLTEYINSITIRLLESHLNDFISYLQINSNSCLKVRLIEGLGSEYSVYEKSERRKKLLKSKDRLLLIAKKEKMNVEKIEYLKMLFSNVNPDILD